MRTLLTALHSRRARRAAALFLSFALAHFAPPLGVGVSAVDLDEGFGGDGFVTHDLGGTEEALAVAVRTDGKLVVLGEVLTSDGSAPEETLLLRYEADGSTDAGFGVGGKTVVEFPGFIFFASDLALQPDGKIIIAGTARANSPNTLFGFGVARYNADGSPDTSFGAGGLAVTDFLSHSPARAVAVQTDGKIVVAGVQHLGGEHINDFAVVRYLSDGSPDTSFGAGGSATADFGQSDGASDVLIQPDGKIVLGGSSHNTFTISTDFAVARFNPNGSLDNTFDADGRVTTSFSSSETAFVTGLALRPDGSLIAAGTTFGRPRQNFALACYLADGTLDASFGEGGKVLTDFDGGTDEAQAVAVRPDGRIVVAGSAFGPGDGSPASFALAFYLADGTHDNSFGAGGRVMTRVPGKFYNLLNGMALLPDGKVVAVGGDTETSSGLGTDIALTRYEAPGAQVPTSFVRFAADRFNAAENCAPALVTVTREGDLSAAATVTYRTRDGSALQQSDYTHATGTLTFAPGESSQSFQVLLNADAHVETDETLFVELVSASPGVNFRRPDFAALAVEDDDTDESAPNPIDDAGQFVCQQYHDFLSRQADIGGLGFWVSRINACGGDPACVEERRQNVSTAFFLSIEFQQTGYFVIRTHKAALGNERENPRYLPFLRDAQRVGRDVRVGVGDWAARLDANKNAFVSEFVTRPEFVAAHGAQNAAEFVDSLFTNAGVTPTASEREGAVAAFGSGGDEGRARALRAVVESGSVYNKLYNPAFVLMQYFGYLRRNPDDFPDSNFRGYDFWLEKLDSFSQPGEDVRDESVALSRVSRAQMVQAFITSFEYRRRFAP
ncbi:MAG TPA: Calx-beta domain-containing protein [Pyrinomonadaceae bacterium]|nr:Calx-beta domain-containing protein [Pyrinomonadaceae bacterium]